MKAIIYNNIGKILRIVDVPEDYLILQKNAEEFILFGTASDELQYIAQGEILNRPLQNTSIDKNSVLANGVDSITITNAPTNVEFTAINLTTGDKISGIFSSTETFSTNVAGKILLKVECWPYLPWEVTIDAV